MCGIFGIVAAGKRWRQGITVDGDRLSFALELMQHRGPDLSRLTFFDLQGSSVTVAAGSDVSYLPPARVVLGHNRLSIIDLSENAGQPMPFKDYWLTYNGEIYNYQELRDKLRARGYEFQTHSDTEVLLTLYDCYGKDMVHHLNGMFAFALWDAHRKQLFMARDRYGIKPLYYTRLNHGEFAFASEIKSLAALPGFDKRLDYAALSEHLTFQNMFQGRTLLGGTRLLEPGHWAILDPKTGGWLSERYWEPVFEPNTSGSLSQQVEALRHAFEQAVNRQLVGDVPIGSFLSGGMDTGAITAVTTRTLPHLHTFTAGFEISGLQGDERLFDERQASQQLARRLQTQHHEMLIEPSALAQVLPQVVWHLDDFRAGISYQNYLASQMVSEWVTVVLSGVGGDELFAGYPWRYEPLLAFASGKAADFEAHYYQSWTRLLSEEQKQGLFTPHVQDALNGFSTRESFRQVLSGCQAEHPLDKALCFDMKTFLHGLLVVEDRLSMAHSVESRVPFLDNRLVDLCLTLPWYTKLQPDKAERPATAKWILKEAVRGLLPDEVLGRRKQGFTPPDASWYRGETRHYIESLLLSPQALERGLFEPKALKALLEAHFRGQQNHRFLIWSLMCLEWWHQMLMDPSVPQAPLPVEDFSGARIL